MVKRLACVLALSAALLAACGGGSPDGAQTAGVSSGGTGSFSSGPITSFGSIVVNGIHYVQQGAQVTREGDAVPTVYAPEVLKLGMVVEVDATGLLAEAGGRRAQAQAVRIASALLGPVELVGTDTLRVMGQLVKVSAATFWEDGLSLAALAQGDVVEVYGFHDAGTDSYRATRIERKADAVNAYQVEGVIRDLDLPNKRCRIGQQLISYDWGSSGSAATVAEGQVGRATLYREPKASGSSVIWPAVKVEVAQALVSDQEAAHIDGLVTQLEPGAPKRFSVNGIPVDASQISCPACAGLQVGAALRVQGRLVAGQVRASAVAPLSLD